MKFILITLITFYQLFFSSLMKQLAGPGSGCRYRVTCSEYAKTMIREHGSLRGTWLAVKRILSCQPYSTIQPY